MIERFAILLPPVSREHDPRGVLAVDLASGQPVTYAHKQSAARALTRRFPSYLVSSGARIVRVAIDTSGDVPTYKVHA